MCNFPATDDSSLSIDYLPPAVFERPGADVLRGLTRSPKSLPPAYFYDARGSELFERICELPEYYPTRTETAILDRYAPEIARRTGPTELVELGSGSSTKTRLLLNAYRESGFLQRYHPIDISASALENSVRQLGKEYAGLEIHGLVGTYELALQWLAEHPVESRTIVFLGSSIGNFDPDERDRFFESIVATLRPGDYFLLGIDLQKPIPILEAAYNDRQGVTAEFNLNVLSHLNARFGGDFDRDLFEHHAFYNREEHRIEMHLRARKSHRVGLSDLDLEVDFLAGETILTEISCKFDLEQESSYLLDRGLQPLQTWTDEKRWFGSILCQAV
ncbi:L-histidine N(alpha)-methyltransferase [Pannus brasiliensis]